MADAKGGQGKEIAKKNVKEEYLVSSPSGQSLAKTISLEEEIEISAASLRSFLHCDLGTE